MMCLAGIAVVGLLVAAFAWPIAWNRGFAAGRRFEAAWALERVRYDRPLAAEPGSPP